VSVARRTVIDPVPIGAPLAESASRPRIAPIPVSGFGAAACE
jgi:hypothetical protein